MIRNKYSSKLINNIKFYLAGILIILLPWHAFLVTWISSFFGSTSDYLPYASKIIAVWKEIFILILGLLFFWKWIMKRKIPIKLYMFDHIFFMFLGIAIFSAIFLTRDLSQMFWGIKYDFSYFFLFYFIRGINFSNDQKAKLLNSFFISATLVLIFGLALYFLFPKEILSYFGYSINVSSFNPEKPIPMYHYVGESDISRAAATFSGPNQFGYYLLIVISFIIVKLFPKNKPKRIEIFSRIISSFKSFFSKKKEIFTVKSMYIIILLLALLSLVLTFSRSAWIGFLFLITVFLFQKKCINCIKRFLIFTLVFLITSLSLFYFASPELFRDKLIRINSTNEHLQSMKLAFISILKEPFGVGIGGSGPAALRFPEENAVYVKKADIDLIIKRGISSDIRDKIWFYENSKVSLPKKFSGPFSKYRYENISDYIRFKPFNKNELLSIPDFKNLPYEIKGEIVRLFDKNYYEVIAENWYLQIFQEYGWFGGFLYLFLLYQLLYYLYINSKKNIYNEGALYALSGMLIVGMFLHVFEDSSSSLTLFLIMGMGDE